MMEEVRMEGDVRRYVGWDGGRGKNKKKQNEKRKAPVVNSP